MISRSSVLCPLTAHGHNLSLFSLISSNPKLSKPFFFPSSVINQTPSLQSHLIHGSSPANANLNLNFSSLTLYLQFHITITIITLTLSILFCRTHSRHHHRRTQSINHQRCSFRPPKLQFQLLCRRYSQPKCQPTAHVTVSAKAPAQISASSPFLYTAPLCRFDAGDPSQKPSCSQTSYCHPIRRRLHSPVLSLPRRAQGLPTHCSARAPCSPIDHGLLPVLPPSPAIISGIPCRCRSAQPSHAFRPSTPHLRRSSSSRLSLSHHGLVCRETRRNKEK